MPVVSLPVTRPAGRMLIVAGASMQPQPTQILIQLGFEPHSVLDPYSAMAELLSSGANYRGMVLSLQSVYREEIAMIATLKRRLPHLEIWLAHTDNRQAALAEAMRLGADGLLGEEGLHRIASSQATPEAVPPPATTPSLSLALQFPPPMEGSTPTADQTQVDHGGDDQSAENEPVLTADELRALLQEQPASPPSGGSEN